MNGRTIAILTGASAALVLGAFSLMLNAQLRLLAIASGFGCGAAGVAIGCLWHKPKSKQFTQAVEDAEKLIVGKAHNQIRKAAGLPELPEWAQGSIDVSVAESLSAFPQAPEATYPRTELLTHPTYSGVSEPEQIAIEPEDESDFWGCSPTYSLEIES